jgi:EAL domain-containing protein (putative c-di-GMP-specific phosphodiesterase class I)
MAQGYYMSPPLPAEKFRRWIVESRWAVAERNASVEAG